MTDDLAAVRAALGHHTIEETTAIYTTDNPDVSTSTPADDTTN